MALPARVNLQRSLGKAGPGQEQSQADGRFEASQLMNGARLLKRVFDIDMQHCPNCGGGELKIIAAIHERPVIEKMLTHLGLVPQPPPKGRARPASPEVLGRESGDLLGQLLER